MRVAIFIDGQNFHHLSKGEVHGGLLDWAQLADFLVKKIGGTRLVEARYYLGTVPGTGIDVSLDDMEKLEGFFVSRFPLKTGTVWCPECGKAHEKVVEKEVDTTMVADIVRMAALDLYDAAIVVSGDADMAPALDAIRIFGKTGWAAVWANGTSARIRQAAYGCLALEEAVKGQAAAFEPAQIIFRPETETLDEAEQNALDEKIFISELKNAMARFPFVSVGYFISKWVFANGRLRDGQKRIATLHRLQLKGIVEIQETPTGKNLVFISKTEHSDAPPTPPTEYAEPAVEETKSDSDEGIPS
jgi:uncharacterized LabA/DUF88 family protein